MTEDGWVFFVDRSVDIIKHKGYRVAAANVESALQEHEQVVGACVVGIPDSKVGERVKAVVVTKEDAQGLAALASLTPETRVPAPRSVTPETHAAGGGGQSRRRPLHVFVTGQEAQRQPHGSQCSILGETHGHEHLWGIVRILMTRRAGGSGHL